MNQQTFPLAQRHIWTKQKRGLARCTRCFLSKRDYEATRCEGRPAPIVIDHPGMPAGETLNSPWSAS